MLSHLREIFRLARAENLRGDDPTEVVAAVLGPIHPRSRNQNMRALPFQQVAEGLQRVRDSGAYWSTKAVCEFMVYTGTRQGAVRGALWKRSTATGRSGPCPLTGPNYWAGPTVSPVRTGPGCP